MAPTSLAGIALGEVGEAIAFGAGFALSRVLEPASAELAYAAWREVPIRLPEAGSLASGVAEGKLEHGRGADWAKSHGYAGEQFDALVAIASRGPELGPAMQAWRRGALSDDAFDTALRRTGLEPRWYAALRELKADRLDLGAIATAVHRGIMRGEGLIIREPPLGGGQVPSVPQSGLDPAAEAEAHGIDHERLRVLIGNTGLPPGLIEMLHLLNMGHVTENDVRRAVAQSNLRNEYMDVVLALRRRLLTPHEYQEAALRGIIGRGEADDGAALSGMETADARTLFETMGRPLAVRAITTGLARGGALGGGYADVPEPYRDAIRRSNIRPEYARLAWANRYTLPSAFVLRSMAQAGELTVEETHQLLLDSGWPPALAKTVAAKWGGSVAGAGKQETLAELEDEYAGGFITEAELRRALQPLGYTGHVQDLLVHLNDARRAKRYREKVVDAIAAAYVAFKIDVLAASSELAEVGVTGEGATMLVALWEKQRRFAIRELTPAQVKRAFTRRMIDRATALEALEDHHYTAADAATLLDE